MRYAGKFVIPVLKHLESLELNNIDKMPKEEGGEQDVCIGLEME